MTGGDIRRGAGVAASPEGGDGGREEKQSTTRVASASRAQPLPPSLIGQQAWPCHRCLPMYRGPCRALLSVPPIAHLARARLTHPHAPRIFVAAALTVQAFPVTIVFPPSQNSPPGPLYGPSGCHLAPLSLPACLRVRLPPPCTIACLHLSSSYFRLSPRPCFCPLCLAALYLLFSRPKGSFRCTPEKPLGDSHLFRCNDNVNSTSSRHANCICVRTALSPVAAFLTLCGGLDATTASCCGRVVATACTGRDGADELPASP